MKTTKIISMAQFMSEVAQLAKLINQDYYTVASTISSQRDKISYTFTCYIHTQQHCTGATPNESIEIMKKILRVISLL